jgi:hypothetical protein
MILLPPSCGLLNAWSGLNVAWRNDRHAADHRFARRKKNGSQRGGHMSADDFDPDYDPVQRWLVNYITEHAEEFPGATDEEAITILTTAARAHFASDTQLLRLMGRTVWEYAAERAIQYMLGTGENRDDQRRGPMHDQDIEDWMYEELTQHREQYVSEDFEGEPWYHPDDLAAAAQEQITPYLSMRKLELLARDLLEAMKEYGSL